MFRIAVVAWMAVIAWGSLSPAHGPSFASPSLLHGIAYMILAWLTRIAFPQRRQVGMVVIAGLAVAYGVLMEMLQTLVPSRAAEIWDVLVDVIGILVGMSLPLPTKSKAESRP
jgi:VanZ family protein